VAACMHGLNFVCGAAVVACSIHAVHTCQYIDTFSPTEQTTTQESEAEEEEEEEDSDEKGGAKKKGKGKGKKGRASSASSSKKAKGKGKKEKKGGMKVSEFAGIQIQVRVCFGWAWVSGDAWREEGDW
jgi:hypothetical protein